MITGGVLTGILLSLMLGGSVSTYGDWRAMFWLAIPVALGPHGLGTAALMAATFPRHPVATTIGYGAGLRSLLHLWRAQPALRQAMLMQAALFASSAFQTILALRLEPPPLLLGAGVAELFGTVGVVGIAAAPLTGRLAGRPGPRLVGLVLGVSILVFGVQSALVSNQHVIYAFQPDARRRLNTIFMTGMFLGGAAGSAGPEWPSTAHLSRRKGELQRAGT
jgi:hypothetical protein